jgi:hypothetical protein
MIDLRTPSFAYNHGGYYAPGDPKDRNTPGGPCSYCQDRIDEMDAAEALVALSQPPCCADRAAFMEPCPSCNEPTTYRTHGACDLPTCNGCPEIVCAKCFAGARYFCPLRRIQLLPPPSAPLLRQEAVGVQSPKAEEKTENK